MDRVGNSKLDFYKNSVYKDLFWILVVAFIYYLLGRFSIKLAFKIEGITAIWPASGIFLSSILLTRRNLRPYLILVLFIIQFIIDVQGNSPYLLCFVFAISVTFEASLSAWLLIRFLGEKPLFNSVRQLLVFFVVSLIIVNSLASGLSAYGLNLFRQVPFWNSWRVWFSADAVGSLMFTPFIMGWAAVINNKSSIINRKQLVELFFLFVSMAIVILIAVEYVVTTNDFIIFLNYFVFPFLFWAALRFSVKEVASASVVLSILLLSLIKNEILVLPQSEAHQHIVVIVQLSLAIVTISSYFLASLILERKIAEKELIAARQKAQENDRRKSAFLANMSHEIRTPMNGILGFAELLNDPGLSGQDQQKFVRIINESGKSLLNIINDIIDISKIESGLMEVRLADISINKNINFVYNFFNHEAESKGIKLIKSDLIPQNAILKSDSEKINAILINLVKNAIKYTVSGSIEFGCMYKCSKDGQNLLVFYVRDTGIGIARDKQKLIFDRFIQVEDAGKKNQQGAGLGLSISRAYVELLGGNMWLESEEGKGSTFYFSIPYEARSPEEFVNEVDASFIAEAVANNANLKLKTLIVEDDEISVILMSKIVETFSREVLIVRSGSKAIEICQNNTDIDLILMDIQMPNLNGYDAVRQIRKFNNRVVIIAQTAFGLTGDMEESIAAGCNDYLSKPVSKDELLTCVQAHFNK